MDARQGEERGDFNFSSILAVGAKEGDGRLSARNRKGGEQGKSSVFDLET